MSDLDYLNLSVDLRRISSWIQRGNNQLADKFIGICQQKFGTDKKIIERREVSEWLIRVADYKKRDWKSAEDALTLSILLKNRFRVSR